MLADSAVENRTAAAGDVPWPLLQIGGAVGCAHDWQSFGGLPVVSRCLPVPGIKTATAMRVVRSVAAINEGCEEL